MAVLVYIESENGTPKKTGLEEDLVDLLYRKVRMSEFKRRQAAPGLRVSTKAFGIGRRFPIVNHFEN